MNYYRLLQTVDRLKRLLFNDGIEYNEKIFKNDSISDLNSEPFVS